MKFHKRKVKRSVSKLFGRRREMLTGESPIQKILDTNLRKQ